jgi:hypothetical protein
LAVIFHGIISGQLEGEGDALYQSLPTERELKRIFRVTFLSTGLVDLKHSVTRIGYLHGKVQHCIDQAPASALVESMFVLYAIISEELAGLVSRGIQVDGLVVDRIEASLFVY